MDVFGIWSEEWHSVHDNESFGLDNDYSAGIEVIELLHLKGAQALFLHRWHLCRSACPDTAQLRQRPSLVSGLQFSAD